MLLHKARRFLRFIQTFLNFIHAVGERIVRQQVQARQDAVKRRNALFRLLELHAALLVVIFMARKRTLQLTTAGVELTNFGFRIGFKGNAQMAANKAAERLMQTLGFLHIKRQGCKTF